MSWRIRQNISTKSIDELIKFLSIVNCQTEGPVASFYKFENYVKSLCDPEDMELYMYMFAPTAGSLSTKLLSDCVSVAGQFVNRL